MSLSDVMEAPVVAPTRSAPDPMLHLVCCRNEDISLCGVDLSGRPPAGKAGDPFDCVVCDDLNGRVCPRDGRLCPH